MKMFIAHVICLLAVYLQNLSRANASLNFVRSRNQAQKEECSNLPIVHDRRFTQDSQTLIDYESYSQGLAKHWYPKKLAPGTLETENILTIPLQNADFVFWSFEMRKRMNLSLWNNDTIIENSDDTQASWHMVPPQTQNMAIFENNNNTIIIRSNQNYVIFIGIWFEVYQHLLIDHIGYLAHLRKTQPPDTRFLLAEVKDNPVFRDMIKQIDPVFSERIDWIPCDSMQNCNKKVQLRGQGMLQLLRPRSTTRHGELLGMARDWINEVYPPLPFATRPKKVIYYKRSGGCFNGRVMDPEQELRLLSMLKSVVKIANRPEEIVIFTGSELSFLQQIDLFRSASVIIGPHGGGHANIIFSLPSDEHCESRPKILEFTTSPDTPEVQGGYFMLSYHNLFATCPWMEYHVQFFVPPSDENVTFIDEETYFNALIEIFDAGQSSRGS